MHIDWEQGQEGLKNAPELGRVIFQIHLYFASTARVEACILCFVERDRWPERSETDGNLSRMHLGGSRGIDLAAYAEPADEVVTETSTDLRCLLTRCGLMQ